MSKKCKICGFGTVTIRHRVFRDYIKCSNCGFISKDSRFLLSRERQLEIYDSHNNSRDDFGYVGFLYGFLDNAVFPYAGSGKKGLDFGSGPTPVLSRMLEDNHDYQMDIFDKFYAPEKVYLGEKYSLVTATEVAEHLEDPMQYFALFRDLLKSDGILAVMTLFHNEVEFDFRAWHYIRDRTHISFYTPKTLEYIAGKVGLKMVYTDSIRYATFVLSK